VRARAAAQFNFRKRAGGIGAKCGDLARHNLATTGVFVAKIDVDSIDADSPRRNQHAFEKSVRIALEVIAVLERSGFAFVDVDREKPRRRRGAHDLPFAPRWKTGAAQAAQRRVLER